MIKGTKVTTKPITFTVESVVTNIQEPKLTTPFITGFVIFPDNKKCYISVPLSCIEDQK